MNKALRRFSLVCLIFPPQFDVTVNFKHSLVANTRDTRIIHSIRWLFVSIKTNKQTGKQSNRETNEERHLSHSMRMLMCALRTKTNQYEWVHFRLLLPEQSIMTHQLTTVNSHVQNNRNFLHTHYNSDLHTQQQQFQLRWEFVGLYNIVVIPRKEEGRIF